MAVTRCTLSTSLEGKERDEEEHVEDVDQDAGPRDRSAPRAAGPVQSVPGVPDAGDSLMLASSLGASSLLYSFISTMRGDGSKEARVEEASTEGRGEV